MKFKSNPSNINLFEKFNGNLNWAYDAHNVFRINNSNQIYAGVQGPVSANQFTSTNFNLLNSLSLQKWTLLSYS